MDANTIATTLNRRKRDRGPVHHTGGSAFKTLDLVAIQRASAALGLTEQLLLSWVKRKIISLHCLDGGYALDILDTSHKAAITLQDALGRTQPQAIA